MMNKILVAVDRFSDNQAAYDSAIGLAQSNGASIMLLHVITESDSSYPILPTYAYYPVMDNRDKEFYQEKLQLCKQLGIDFLVDLAQKATDAGVSIEYTQLIGNPGRSICELASNWDADLILVGSRGLKGLKEMFLGSVSNYVAHNAPCSVLIARTHCRSQLEPEVTEQSDLTKQL